VSPRSQEFLDEAHDRLEASRLALANGFDGVAASLAYSRCSTRRVRR
jgi:hypothetical protein